MSARDGMSDLISQLRGMCDAGTADYTISGSSGATWWDDTQLQDVLDRQRRDHIREPLMMAPVEVATDTLQYFDFYFTHEHVEGSASGTAAWILANSAGSVVAASAYSLYPEARQIRFAADQLGTAYYLSYRSFDLERAAADVWERKAGHVQGRFDLSTDNHNMKRSQLFDHCLKMADLYRRRARAHVAQRVRDDVNPVGWDDPNSFGHDDGADWKRHADRS